MATRNDPKQNHLLASLLYVMENVSSAEIAVVALLRNIGQRLAVASKALRIGCARLVQIR
jgi:hypothetical protein